MKARGPRAGGQRPRAALLSILLALVLSACDALSEVDASTLGTPATTTPVTTSPVTTSAVTTGPAANDLSGFARTTVAVNGEPLTVAVADTPVLRAQGLMGVTDLVDVDGMLFVFDSEVDAAFWMKDTLIPLDIWFFDSEGEFVDTFTMTPCDADPCRTYPADGPFRYALETAVGRLSPLGAAHLDL